MSYLATWPWPVLGLLAGWWWPPAMRAEPCSVTMADACVALVDYNIWYGIAMLVWQADRMLLQAAYQIDHVRWWLVTEAFSSAFEAIRSGFEPLMTPAAVVAAMLALLLVLCVPLLGRIEILNIRQIFVWTVLGPLLLAQAGPLLLELERTRSDVATILTAQVGQSAGTAFSGTPRDSEPSMGPEPLYQDENICPGGQVRRPAPSGAAGDTQALHLDDLAAAFVLADAQDIHCPDVRPPSHTLPDRFFQPDAYAFDGDMGDGPTLIEMKQAAERIKAGVVRLALGLIPATVALMEALIQLLLSASLVVLWLATPLLMIALLFSRDLRPLGELLQRTAQVIVTSWMVTILLALIGVSLLGAAQAGNPSAYAALSLGAGFLVYRMLRAALDLFSANLVGVGAVVSGASGAAVAGATVALGGRASRIVERVASGSLRGLTGAAATGASMVATAAIAARHTTSGRYVAGAIGGHIQPIARVGAIAAALGELDPELGAGLAAGRLAVSHGLTHAAAQARRDAALMLPGGQSLSDTARARRSGRRQAGGPLEQLPEQAGGERALAPDRSPGAPAARRVAVVHRRPPIPPTPFTRRLSLHLARRLPVERSAARPIAGHRTGPQG
jgi:hypothetical protein